MGSTRRLIFNTSLPRSGGTLLQLFLGQNPTVFASVHSPLIELLHNLAGLYEANYGANGAASLAHRSFRAAASGLLREFYSFTGHGVVVDKGGTGALGYGELIESALGRLEAFACVRDPRAIIASFEKDFQAGRLAPNETPPANCSTTLADRVEWWMRSSPLASGWQRLKPYLAEGAASSRVHILRYEDFAAAPQAAMGLLYDAFGLEQFEHDFTAIPELTPEVSFSNGRRATPGPLKPTRENWGAIIPPEIAGKIVMMYMNLFVEIYPEAYSMNPDSIISEAGGAAI